MIVPRSFAGRVVARVAELGAALIAGLVEMVLSAALFESALAALTRLIVVVVDYRFFDGALEAAAHSHARSHAHPAHSHAVTTAMAEAVQDGLDTFKGQCSGGDTRRGLSGSAQEAGRTTLRRDILRLLHILRLLVLRRRSVRRLCRLRVLRNGLVRRRLRRRGLGVPVAQKPAQKAGGVRGLLRA